MSSPEQISAEVAERIKLAGEAAAEQAGEQPKAESQIIIEKPKSKEPNWAELTELEATNLRLPLNIPLIDHDIPAYMDIKLADTEYVAVWANRDQRRLGQLEAEGYEFIRPEHIAKGFKLPLKFDSEKLYIYQDVIAMRVHKRILFGKRRRTQELSVKQLQGMGQIALDEVNKQMIQRNSRMEEAFDKGRMSFFDVNI